jgi:hypothetical protein
MGIVAVFLGAVARKTAQTKEIANAAPWINTFLREVGLARQKGLQTSVLHEHAIVDILYDHQVKASLNSIALQI